MTLEDAEFVLSVRNNDQTRSFLHNDTIFDREQFLKWFKQDSPAWFIITNDETPVGYIRTSDVDLLAGSLYVGADIHPDHRRNGYAIQGYNKLFEILEDKCYRYVDLAVLETNTPAQKLYIKLGFEEIKREPVNGKDSIIMRKQLSHTTGTSCKVIPTFFGFRRAWPRHDCNCSATYRMLHFLWGKESILNYGVPMDTIIVNNVLRPDEVKCLNLNTFEIEDPIFYSKCEDFIRFLNGKPTPNGKIKTTFRENIGLSFGAYDFGFYKFENDYDFWFLCEDDQIVLKDGVMATAIQQIRNLHTNVGFVAAVGINDTHGNDPDNSHAHGAVGITTRSILRKIREGNYCEEMKRDILPYLFDTENVRGRSNACPKHEHRSEIPFTNSIYKLGYSLVDLEGEDLIVSWKIRHRRNCHGEAKRLIEYDESMEPSIVD
jgi:ribosomal protein S18 acetylase RimI-like enzyme